MKTFNMPDLGEGLHDAEIVSWRVSSGDRVVADQPLLSVETEKAVVEIPAPWSGVITRIYVESGDVITIGAPLVDFDIGVQTKDVGAIVGELEAAQEETTAPHPATLESADADKVARGKATPAVRNLAHKLNVDLTSIIGSGPGGAITRKDIEASARLISDSGTARAWEAVRGVRRSMARNMARANAEIAATSVTDEANIENWSVNENITLRLVRAIVAACKAEPALNAWYDGVKEARLVHQKIDLGLAMNTGDGLFVPVLRDAGNRSIDELHNALAAIKKEVSERTIPAGELRGQTITLSNFGMNGGRHAALIVVPPQVAILGVGRITSEPRVVDQEIRPCRVLPLSLTFDHRAVTGVEATRFLMAALKDMES